jgi:hypothetical protein
VSPQRTRLLRRLVPVLLTVGVLVMVAFDHTLTLLLGIVLMFAFVVCGAFLIASPEFLDGDAGEDRPPVPQGPAPDDRG